MADDRIKYPIIHDPYVSKDYAVGELAEIVLMCHCGFKVTDLQSQIDRARQIIKEHQRTQHPAARSRV